MARELGAVFDTVAQEYERARPTYPDELVDRACERAGLASGDRVLEIGCGTGQLTRSLIARGLDVVAVEPGARLRALASERLGGAGALQFIGARFEDASLPPTPFPAVFCAAALHWIDPAVGWRKVAAALAPGGRFALLQFCGLNEPSCERDLQELLAVVERVAPEAAAEWPTYRDLAGTYAGLEERRGNVSKAWAWIGGHDLALADAGVLFDDVQVACVPMVVEQTAEEVTALVRTVSFYARLSAEQQQAIECEHVALQERLGRPIRYAMVAVLVTARRALRGGDAALHRDATPAPPVSG
ncbi:MAG TPA: class I SAM-dependent methyltransferase [Solirubrobacteraceae bacterium]|jgi:SAM-dependent methyltransferase|nr:class I SAM-dependent methyltransferase [Solirubrobacteraceae bacterium]